MPVAPIVVAAALAVAEVLEVVAARRLVGLVPLVAVRLGAEQALGLVLVQLSPLQALRLGLADAEQTAFRL